ncbi:MAG: hypothetical protein KDK78_06595 [Chlamydiia bacterium]|nr:hypothetical protein [Chlamydiia bacterium]
MITAKRLGIPSLAKVLGCMYFFIGLFAAIALLVYQALFIGAVAWETLALPIMYAICGFIGGIITAFFYNLAARYVGGVQIYTD